MWTGAAFLVGGLYLIVRGCKQGLFVSGTGGWTHVSRVEKPALFWVSMAFCVAPLIFGVWWIYAAPRPNSN
jgi:hypothetical protein